MTKTLETVLSITVTENLHSHVHLSLLMPGKFHGSSACAFWSDFSKFIKHLFFMGSPPHTQPVKADHKTMSG